MSGRQEMLEAMKQALEALEKSQSALSEELSAWDIDPPLQHVQESHDLCGPAITSLRQAIKEHAMYEVQRLGQEIEQEPVAWMHIMDNTEGIKANGAGIVSITQKRKHPFGKAGIDFSKSYPVTSTPLYTHPPQRTEQNFCPRCGKRTNDIHTCTPPQRKEQEPVAYDKTELNCFAQDLYDQKMREGKRGHYESMFHVIHQCVKKVASPPQRTWVGLTDEEIIDVIHPLVMADMSDQATDYEIARAIEAKLKEKNNA